jgi:hypothetical protein
MKIDVCKELNMETLKERRRKQDLKLVHSILSVKGNINYEKMFEKSSDRQGPRTRNTEGVNDLRPPLTRTEVEFFIVCSDH